MGGGDKGGEDRDHGRGNGIQGKRMVEGDVGKGDGSGEEGGMVLRKIEVGVEMGICEAEERWRHKS